MNKSNLYHKLLTGGGRCKALLTLVMLMLLTLATSARALADDDRQSYAVFDAKYGTLTFYCDNQKATHSNPMELNEGDADPEWYQYGFSITTVEFDPLFQYARPTSCYCWFYGCGNLTEIKGIQYLNTSEVTDMSYMFYCCSSLQSLDLSSLNTAKVTDMSSMFASCPVLESLDLSSFNTAKVTNMSNMFAECYALKTILVGSGWNVANEASSGYMFSDCENLIGGNGTKYQDVLVDDGSCAHIDGEDGEDGYLTSLKQCTHYAELIYNPDGETKTLVFRYGYKPKNAMQLNEDYADPEWYQYASSITTVEFDPLFKYARPKTCYEWFSECEILTEIKGIQYLNTSQVTNMYSMFEGCSSLQSLDLSSFNTSEVKNMDDMFDGCESLESLNLSSFNTEKVTDMSSMFSDCSALKSLDLSSFNTSEVEDMSYMFDYCSALKSLDLSSFNTSKVTDMISMFYGCSSLKSLDLSSFNTSAVTFMVDMFDNCESLESLNLSSFNTAKVTLMNNMFANCSALKIILVGSGWNVDNVTSSSAMFTDCEKLTGGEGITYTDDKPTDKTYARIDGEDGKPGYLTSLEQCEPYAMVVDNGKTLRFCFGPKLKTLKPEGAKDLSSSNWNNFASSITKVEFDNLFRHARPTSCAYWFAGFKNLTEIIGIGNLNTSEVTDMYCMFNGCEKLTSLDLSSFNTASVKTMVLMFNGCSDLTTILVDRNLWKIKDGAIGDLMFKGCYSLVGGNGTTYLNKQIIDLTYAIVDGNGGEGYLTHNALKLTKSNGKTTAEIQGDFEDGIGAAVSVDKETKVSQVTFYRSFTQGVTATVMFPFSFTADDKINGTFRTLSKVAPDDNGVWTAELSYPISKIQANTPYIFSPSDDIKSMTFTGENGNGITLLPVTGDLTNGANDGWQLHGVYSKKIWTEDSKPEYGFAGEKVEEDNIEAGEFVRAGEGAWADPMRCYLTYEGNGNPFTAKSSVVLPDRIRVVFPEDKDDDITPATNPDEVITPVSSVSEPDEIKVWSFGGTVFIEAQPDMDYTIIDLTGRVINKGITHSTREEVSLNAKGIVIVRIANKSFKIK